MKGPSQTPGETVGHGPRGGGEGVTPWTGGGRLGRVSRVPTSTTVVRPTAHWTIVPDPNWDRDGDPESRPSTLYPLRTLGGRRRVSFRTRPKRVGTQCGTRPLYFSVWDGPRGCQSWRPCDSRTTPVTVPGRPTPPTPSSRGLLSHSGRPHPEVHEGNCRRDLPCTEPHPLLGTDSNLKGRPKVTLWSKVPASLHLRRTDPLPRTTTRDRHPTFPQGSLPRPFCPGRVDSTPTTLNRPREPPRTGPPLCPVDLPSSATPLRSTSGTPTPRVCGPTP